MRFPTFPGRVARWALLAVVVAALVPCVAGRSALADAGPGSGRGGGAGGGGAPAAGASVAAARVAKRVAIIPIKGELEKHGIAVGSVQRRIATAVRARADAIVFEFDVPGGVVGSTELAAIIKAAPVANTVAWIHPRALGGGAIAALACREIVLGETAELGDAKPVAPTGNVRGWQTRQQAYQALVPAAIADVVHSARVVNEAAGDYVRDEDLARAFVVNDVDLWMVRELSTGRTVCVTAPEYEVLFPGTSASPTVVRRLAAPGTNASGVGGAAASGVQVLPSRRPQVTPAMAGQWELVAKVPTGGDSLRLTGAELVTFGLAANVEAAPHAGTPGGASVRAVRPIRDERDVAAFFQAKYVRTIEPSSSEGLVLFLTHPWVRTILIVVFLIALFAEMSHPGAALPGLIALVALLMFIAPSMVIGLAQWWEALAIVLGVLLLALEILVIPGFGVAGVLGLVLLFIGLVATFVPPGTALFPDSPREQSDLLYGLSAVLLAMVTAGLGISALAKHLPSLPLLNHLVLRSGDIESSDPLLAAMEPESIVAVGEVGVSLTPLRPAGRAQIGAGDAAVVVDVVSEFGFIDPGRPVRVVAASAMRIAVEAIRVSDSGPAGTAGPTGDAGPA